MTSQSFSKAKLVQISRLLRHWNNAVCSFRDDESYDFLNNYLGLPISVCCKADFRPFKDSENNGEKFWKAVFFFLEVILK